jgi:hypothetical protein
VVAWISLSIALLLSVAGALYWALPNWKIWRGGLKPLHGAHATPDMLACLTDLCIEAGLSRYPTFLLNPYDMIPGGVTFGRLGRYFVALNSGLLMRFQTDPAVFRSIVLHELGHIRNKVNRSSLVERSTKVESLCYDVRANPTRPENLFCDAYIIES